MSAPDTTIWPASPHIAAKHRILREWWNAWLPILATRNKRLIYFDGFAGPGVYEGGEDGSPLVVLNATKDHSRGANFAGRDLHFVFVEPRADRIGRLKQEVQSRFPSFPSGWKIEYLQSRFSDSLRPALDSLDARGAKLAPAFAFLDPFGYGDLPMDLVSRLLSYPGCDVLVTFMARDINRFAEDDHHALAIDNCLGGSAWRTNLPDTPEQRRTFFVRTYEEEIRNRVPDACVRSFEISGDAGPIYFLVGASKNLEGVRVMKRAMWVTDPTGNYRFSDKTAGNTTLIQFGSDIEAGKRAAVDVEREFAHRRATVEEVERFVLYKTPWQFKKLDILAPMEEDGRIREVVGRKKARSWPPGCELVFK